MALQTVWFFLWGLLWAVYFITDGFDLGTGALYLSLGRNEEEKRIILNSIGPLWDGNEVWLITAGGVTFAAFPIVYAVMFSSLYSVLMLILFALIIRGVSLEFRNKIENPRWKKAWDICFFIGSFAPALLFGVAFANIFMGIPINEQGVYQGTLFTLLNPYGLLGGLLFLLLFMMHGSLWLAIKTEDELHENAVRVLHGLWPVLLVVAVTFLVATKFFTGLYDNYIAHPILFVVVLFTVLALLGIKVYSTQKSYWKAWFSSAATIAGATFFGIIGLYPIMLPSSIDAGYSLTAYNSSSSPLTLTIMLVVAVIFLPVVIAYQAWTYNLFKGKVTEEDISHEEAY